MLRFAQHDTPFNSATKFRDSALTTDTLAGAIFLSGQPGGVFSDRLAGDDLLVLQEELRRALPGAADHGDEPGDLAARDQPQSGALGAGEHRPVGILGVAHLAGILQHEERPRPHLLGNPFVQDVHLLDHVTSVRENLCTYEAALRGRVAPRRADAFCLRPRSSARTWRTVSLRQTASKGWRAFFRRSTTCCAEFSR